MKKNLLGFWVMALRSGRYRQGRGTLRLSPVSNASNSRPSHCCLGVLCDLRRRAYGEGEWTKEDWGGDIQFRLDDFSDPAMPPQMWVGEKLSEDLAAMNDDGGSYKKIADFLEQGWREGRIVEDDDGLIRYRHEPRIDAGRRRMY